VRGGRFTAGTSRRYPRPKLGFFDAPTVPLLPRQVGGRKTGAESISMERGGMREERGAWDRLGEAGTRISNVARESESDAQLYSYGRGGSAKVCNAVARRRRGGAALAEREQAQPPVA
jgi:hypothetical protein